MFVEALRSLPAARRTVVVALRALTARPELSDPELTVVALDATPPGQALSVEAALGALDDAGDIVVSACDHGIVIDPAAIASLTASSADAAVLTMAGYPGAGRQPSAYAYVEADAADRNSFPRVRRVSVKTPISASPSRDPLLVGTFWFRNKAVLAAGLAELKRRDRRVHGELYLDPIVEVLASAGHDVRLVGLEGYLGWGDPDAMAETLYWRDVFCGFHAHARRRCPSLEP